MDDQHYIGKRWTKVQLTTCWKCEMKIALCWAEWLLVTQFLTRLHLDSPCDPASASRAGGCTQAFKLLHLDVARACRFTQLLDKQWLIWRGWQRCKKILTTLTAVFCTVVHAHWVLDGRQKCLHTQHRNRASRHCQTGFS